MIQIKEEIKELVKKIFVLYENKQELQFVCLQQYRKDSKFVDFIWMSQKYNLSFIL